MIKRFSILFFYLTILTFFCQKSFSQTHIGHKNENKFKQLYEEFMTPNNYRTASGAPGNLYYQQKVDYNMDIILDEKKIRFLEKLK